MRILHLTAGSDAGGLSQYIFTLGQAMAAQGHEIFVAGEIGASHALFEKASFPWIVAKLKSGPIGLRTVRNQLPQHFKSNPPDVIHTHYRKPTLVARSLQKIWNVPILYTVHQPRITIKFPWSLFTDFGDHTHVASDDAGQWLINDAQVPADRISVIPHGVALDQFPQRTAEDKRRAREQLNLPQDAIVAGFVGRFDHPKNPEWMISLAKALRSVHIVMIGEGPDEPTLRKEIDRHQLSNVTLLPYGNPLPVYQASDSILNPSLREGFSLASAEAMCVGVPVFRTRTGGSKELILEGVTGQTCEIDERQFVKGATEFLSDLNHLARMGENAARHIREHFSFDRQLARTIDLYEQLRAKRDRIEL